MSSLIHSKILHCWNWIVAEILTAVSFKSLFMNCCILLSINHSERFSVNVLHLGAKANIISLIVSFWFTNSCFSNIIFIWDVCWWERKIKYFGLCLGKNCHVLCTCNIALPFYWNLYEIIANYRCFSEWVKGRFEIKVYSSPDYWSLSGLPLV